MFKSSHDFYAVSSLSYRHLHLHLRLHLPHLNFKIDIIIPISLNEMNRISFYSGPCILHHCSTFRLKVQSGETSNIKNVTWARGNQELHIKKGLSDERQIRPAPSNHMNCTRVSLQILQSWHSITSKRDSNFIPD